MKINKTKIAYSILFSVVVVGSCSIQLHAQENVNQLITENLSDGVKLVEGYVSPVMKSMSLGVNQGWYNTAKPHKTAGVDLTITVNGMYIPSSDKFYNVNDLKLSQIELSATQPAGINNGNVPTIFGPAIAPSYQTKSDPNNSQFSGPAGKDLKKTIGMKSLPVPMYTLGFGLPKAIDVKIRFFPKSKFDDLTVQMLGLGVMHDIKQYIPGIKLLPFDLSVLAGFTNLKLDYALDPDHPDQHGILSINSTTIQGIISKKVSVLTGYFGVGYNIAESNISLKGTYDIDDDQVVNDPDDVKDPLNSNFAASGMRATVGLRLKLWVFTFHGDYTIQKYNSLSVGFGINVR